MKVSSINSIVTPKTTGYTAAAGLLITGVSGIVKNKCMKRIHKPIGFMTAFLTALHIVLIEYNNYKWKHKQM